MIVFKPGCKTLLLSMAMTAFRPFPFSQVPKFSHQSREGMKGGGVSWVSALLSSM